MSRALTSLVFLLGCMAGLFFLIIPTREPQPQWTRQEFADRLFQIERGMSQSEVLAILGKPDDILTEVDPVDLETGNTTEIWCYGTRRHLEAPTLGKIEFDFEKKVIFTSNQDRITPRTVISPSLVSETELRNLFELLNQVSGPYFRRAYNPLPVIRAVNALHPLGPVKALAVLEEHFEVTGSIGDFLVLLALFENSPGRVFLSTGLVGPLSDEEFHTRFPRFPILLIDDVPFFIREEAPGGLNLYHHPDQNLFAFYREKGIFRQKPLNPSEKPFDLLDKWESLTQTIYPPDESRFASKCIARQILLLTRTIHDKAIRMDCLDLLPPWESTSAIKKFLTEGNSIPFFWNPIKNIYTLSDGSHSKLAYRSKYPKVVIYFDEIKSVSRLIIERIDESSVQISFDWYSGNGMKIYSLEISVIREKGRETLFQTDPGDFLTVLNQGRQGSFSAGSEADLPQGESVTVTIKLDGRTKSVSGLKP